MFHTKDTSSQTGIIGLKVAELYYAMKGLPVCRPDFDIHPYDLLVDHGLRIRKVQVKLTGHRKNGAYACTTSDKEVTQCDDFFVYTTLGYCYIIPTSEVPSGKLILTEKYDKFLVWNPSDNFFSPLLGDDL